MGVKNKNVAIREVKNGETFSKIPKLFLSHLGAVSAGFCSLVLFNYLSIVRLVLCFKTAVIYKQKAVPYLLWQLLFL